MKKHIFVIGDLMIDHDVFVTPGDNRESERPFLVSHRRDTAGGAANSARALATINTGKTYLWGVLGRSHWGSFRSILERSQAVDGAERSVELRGVQDETDAPMDTTTRLLEVRNGRIERRARFDDMGHVHLTNFKRETLLHHLERSHFKDPLDAILVNDFGRKCVTPALLGKIAEFATDKKIPLYLDPHVGQPQDKYSGIRARAILPNLKEWCEIVGEGERYGHWRHGLDDEATLVEMAQKSFRHFDQIEIHVIKCDKDGAVLLFPHPSKKHYYAIYRVPPVESDLGPEGDQIGSGDVLSAAFAAECDRVDISTGSMFHAYLRAGAVVAAYRDAGWHRMPTAVEVSRRQKDLPRKLPRPQAEVSKGVLFLPKTSDVVMRNAHTAIPGMYSMDVHLREVLGNIVRSVAEQWPVTGLQSVVIGAPPGSGKSRIRNELTKMVHRHSRTVIDLSADVLQHLADPLKAGLGLLAKKGTQAFLAELDAYRQGQELLVVVDEAWKGEHRKLLRDFGVELLNVAHERGIKFLLVSAEFSPDLEREENELFGRCDCHYLPDLSERLADIPYIVSASLFDYMKDPSEIRLQVEAGFLLAVTDYALEKPDVRRLCRAVEQAFVVAVARKEAGQVLQVRSGDARKATKYVQRGNPLGTSVFEFIR